MGSYAYCWLGRLQLGMSKNSVDLELLRLFRPADKHVVGHPWVYLPSQLRFWVADLEENECLDYKVVYYGAPVRAVRDRLDFLGYTLDVAKECFRTTLIREAEQRRSWGFVDEAQLELIRDLTPERWIQCVVALSKLHPEVRPGLQNVEHLDSTLQYVARHDWYGLPELLVPVGIRLLLEAQEDDEDVLYDVTELVDGGYFEAEADLLETEIGVLAAEYSAGSRIIVLTEGSTDSSFLREALDLLYPHLADYFSFMDFESWRPAGGAGELVKLVKAFAAAGVANRVIALFDNDTAAAVALKALDDVRLPPRFVILRLPELGLLRNYPTLGPNGRVMMNVNGLAASLELYMGEDVLLHDGSLLPVQWKGYDQSLNRYQGEVLDKRGIQTRFREKLMRSGRPTVDDPNWFPMRQVLQQLLCAYSSTYREDMLRMIDEWYSS